MRDYNNSLKIMTYDNFEIGPGPKYEFKLGGIGDGELLNSL